MKARQSSLDYVIAWRCGGGGGIRLKLDVQGQGGGILDVG